MLSPSIPEALWYTWASRFNQRIDLQPLEHPWLLTSAWIFIITLESAKMTMTHSTNPSFQQGDLDSTKAIIVNEAPERQELMETEHAIGHFGGKALARAIALRGNYWPGMARECALFVAKCRDC